MSNLSIWVNSGLIVFITIAIVFLAEIRGWRKSLSMYIFANRKIQIMEGAGAICVHWIWAPALFISPAIAYNYGWKGLLYFCVPNGISVMIAGYLGHKLRQREESSLTNLIAQRSLALATTLRIMFAVVSFAALVLAFTATAKLWGYSMLNVTQISVEQITAIFGALAFTYTVLGGLRTSVFTGFMIFLGWIAFAGAIFVGLDNNDLNLFGPGVLRDGFTNELFMASFGAAFLPLILVGATGHGMMWQKAMAMPKENILPAFITAGFAFMAIIFIYGLMALWTINASAPAVLSKPDTAALVGIAGVLGNVGLAAFATLFLWQTLTVMDSALNYICYVVSEDIFKGFNLTDTKHIMYGTMGFFVVLAWLTATMGWNIWPLFMIMSVIRTSCFTTMWNVAKGIAFNAKVAVAGIILGGGLSFAMALYNKFYKVPWLDFWAIMVALLIPLLAVGTVQLYDKFNRYIESLFEDW